MKIRKDFVTNSSSSSFLIDKKFLTEEQIEAIRYHSELGERLGMLNAEESWHIDENDSYIVGYTMMDNFSMRGFLNAIGAGECVMDWSEYPIPLPKEEIPIYDGNSKKARWQKLLEDIKTEDKRYED